MEEGKDVPAYTPLEGSLEIAGNIARTPALDIGAVPFEIPFAWTDRLGLAGEAGFRLRVDALKDAAPTCYLQGIDRQKVMLPEETVDFEVLAEDDFGVKATGIEWSGQFTRPTDETPAKGELKLADGALRGTPHAQAGRVFTGGLRHHAAENHPARLCRKTTSRTAPGFTRIR